MAADEKLWQLRGSVVGMAGATPASEADADSPAAFQSEPDWSSQQVLVKACVSADAAMSNPAQQAL